MADIQDILYGRMSPVLSPQTKARTSAASSKRSVRSKTQTRLSLNLRRVDGTQPEAFWETVTLSSGELSTLNFGEFPKGENASTLSQILQVGVPGKYYLSQKACLGILRRASARGKELPEVLHRLHLFVRPGGMLILDIRDPASFRALDGGTFVDETDDVLCLWRAEFDAAAQTMHYGMDLFTRAGELWSRASEEHIEYAHTPERLAQLLTQAGFLDVTVRRDGPQADAGRIFLTAMRSLEYGV